MTAIQMALLAASGGRPPEALTNTFTTSDGKWAVGDSVTFSKGTGTRSFPVRNGTIFRIALYGAGGGGFTGFGNYGSNANGGLLDATINLSSYQNTNLTIVTGGGGGDSSGGIDGCGGGGNGGFNGGGYGAGSAGGGGGGRTDLRTSSGDAYSELLVAGGGGGGYSTLGISGSRVNGNSGCGGMFGDYCGDNAGGGGGYYGGSASCSDDGQNSGSGSNYNNPSLTTVLNNDIRIGSQTGGNSGDGYFTILVVGAA